MSIRDYLDPAEYGAGGSEAAAIRARADVERQERIERAFAVRQGMSRRQRIVQALTDVRRRSLEQEGADDAG